MILLGIDGAKDEIVIFDGKTLRIVRNGTKEIQKFLSSFEKPGLLAIEATGGYEREVLTQAHAAGWKTFLLQPAWVKAYARATGGRAKTDAVDAKVIFDYLKTRQDALRPWVPLNERAAHLQSILRQRQRLAGDIARVRTRYRALNLDPKLLKVALKGLEVVKKALDKELVSLLKDDPKAKLLLAVPGVGPQTAAGILATFAKGEFKTAEAFVAFAGLDPVAKESGKSQGERRISKKGDETLRRALFMAAFAGSRLPAWKQRYLDLKAKGMKPTKAQVALARKIATILYAIHQKDLAFDPLKVAPKTKNA